MNLIVGKHHELWQPNHGSHKFIDDFLSFIYPVAAVISSGDNETYTHPRPDTLGAIGKHSRGKCPLIFSTELARSSKEKLDIKESDLEKISQLYREKDTATGESKVQWSVVIIFNFLGFSHDDHIKIDESHNFTEKKIEKPGL